jgi:hypothetical protein
LDFFLFSIFSSVVGTIKVSRDGHFPVTRACYTQRTLRLQVHEAAQTTCIKTENCPGHLVMTSVLHGRRRQDRQCWPNLLILKMMDHEPLRGREQTLLWTLQKVPPCKGGPSAPMLDTWSPALPGDIHVTENSRCGACDTSIRQWLHHLWASDSWINASPFQPWFLMPHTSCMLPAHIH